MGLQSWTIPLLVDLFTFIPLTIVTLLRELPYLNKERLDDETEKN